MRHVSQRVSNPNFIEDLMRMLSLSNKDSVEECLGIIKDASVTTYEKLITLVDRIEFIEHLNIVKKHCQDNYYTLSDKKVIGIKEDIEPLQIYLALTCIDILSSNFERFDKWLIKNMDDVGEEPDIVTYVKTKGEEYDQQFRLSSNFVKAFLNCSEKLKRVICQNIIVMKRNGESSNDISDIAAYLYRIRNKYTHEGRRFFASPMEFSRQQSIGPRDEDSLILSPGFDLLRCIVIISIEQANRKMNSYHNVS